MPMLVSRRRALQVALSAAVSLAAACTSAAPPAPTTPPAPAKPTEVPKPAATSAAAPAVPPATVALPPATATAIPAAAPQATGAQPRLGGKLRYGSLDDITSLNGHQTSSVQYDTLYHVFDRLTEYDLKQQPQPMLAEQWDVSADGRQLKLTLRKGVQFHIGRELTSDDIKWNFLRVRDPKIASSQLGLQSAWFSTIDTPDKYTLVLGSEVPRPAVFDLFEFLNIVDPVTMEGPDGPTKPVGTGPFTFGNWAQGNQFVLNKNRNYWNSGLPYVDQFEMTVIKDGTSMVTQLEAGALDIIKTPAIRDFVRLKADPDYQSLLEPEGRFFFVGANVTVKPLDNKKVRQALAHCIDRKRFVDTVSLGVGTAQSLPWPSFAAAYEATKANAYPFDPDRAKALLAEAGVSSFGLDLYPVSLYPEMAEFAQIMQSDMAKAGVTLTIKPTDLATFIQLLITQSYQGLYLTAMGTASLNPISLLSGGSYKDPGNNSGFVSPAYTELLTSLAGELDPAKQKQLYGRINDFLIDEAFVWPIATAPFRVSARAKLRNIGFLLHDGIDVKRMWLEP
jgi:peptide/nickel transport system substrate-binding protein